MMAQMRITRFILTIQALQACPILVWAVGNKAVLFGRCEGANSVLRHARLFAGPFVDFTSFGPSQIIIYAFKDISNDTI